MVCRSWAALGRAVSGQEVMHSMHWVQFSGKYFGVSRRSPYLDAVVARGRCHYSDGGERGCGLIVAEARSVFLVEGFHLVHGKPFGLLVVRGAATFTAAICVFGQKKLASHSGKVRSLNIAVRHLLQEGAALCHDFHVGVDNRIAEFAELLVVLRVDYAFEMVFVNVEGPQERGYLEKGSQE